MKKRLLAIVLLIVTLLTMSSCESENDRRQREYEEAKQRTEEARKKRDEAWKEYNSLKKAVDFLNNYGN